MLAESMLLALAGAALGLVVATWGLHLLLAALPSDLGGAAIGVNGWTLGFTVGLALLTGAVFGIGPAWAATVADPQAVLQAGAARTTGTRGQHRVRDALVVTEVALSLLLLAGAGLMIRTVGNLLHVDPGFDAGHVASAEFWLTGTRYASTATVGQLYQQLIERAGADSRRHVGDGGRGRVAAGARRQRADLARRPGNPVAVRHRFPGRHAGVLPHPRRRGAGREALRRGRRRGGAARDARQPELRAAISRRRRRRRAADASRRDRSAAAVCARGGRRCPIVHRFAARSQRYSFPRPRRRSRSPSSSVAGFPSTCWCAPVAIRRRQWRS